MLFGFFKRRPKYPDIERRREPRFEVEDEFTIEFRDGDKHYIGASRDISLHGIRFVAMCKPGAGKNVFLNLRLPTRFPGTRNITVKAKVVRVYKPLGTQRYRIGCELFFEDERDLETMRQFIYWLQHERAL